MSVYLIHADDGRHYVGHARDDRLATRMREHRRTPTGIFKRWHALGIEWTVARVWRARGQDTEEAIKAWKRHRDWCPMGGCAGRKARSSRGLRYPHGAYWIARARMHGKDLSVRTIERHKRLRRAGKAIPARPWVPRAEHLADGHACQGISVQVAEHARQVTLPEWEPAFALG